MNLDEIEKFALFWAGYGQQLVTALLVLVAGIVIIQRSGPFIRRLCAILGVNERFEREMITGVHVLMAVILAGFVLRHLGVAGPTVRQLLMASGLAAAAIMLLLRPYLPKLPFKAGNLIKTGSLLGKVEGISLLNTRLKTFDGLIVTVPNATILNDYLINYHTTPNRRIRLNVAIQYDQDIVQAKRLIESLMIQDPRVLATPRPVVYVVNLADSWVELGGRCWAKNAKAWVTRCELLEKIRYRFDQEGIEVAFPRHDIYVFEPSPRLDPNPSDHDDLVNSMLATSESTAASELVPRGN